MSENESEKQKANGEFVEREVYLCQSYLVDEMLKKEIFSYEDIVNLYETEEEAKENGNEEPEPKEIFEWWVVSEWLAEKLEEEGEPILKNDYGTWWGRCCSGQAILLDSVIDRIRKKVMLA